MTKMGKIRLPRGASALRRELGCGQELRVFLTAYQKSGAWDCAALTNETEAAPLLSGAASVAFSVCPHHFIQKPGRRSCDSGRWRLGSAVPVTGGGRRLKLWDVGIWRGRPVNL